MEDSQDQNIISNLFKKKKIMATPSNYNNSSLIFPNPVPVIGPEFCSSPPIDLVMVKSSLTLSETKFTVTDSNGNLVFRVCRFPLSFRSTHLILDSAGKTPPHSKEKGIHIYIYISFLDLHRYLHTFYSSRNII